MGRHEMVQPNEARGVLISLETMSQYREACSAKQERIWCIYKEKNPFHILGENVPLWLPWFPWGGQFSLILALNFRNPIPMPDLFGNRVDICFSICPLRCSSIAYKHGKGNRKKKKKHWKIVLPKIYFCLKAKAESQVNLKTIYQDTNSWLSLINDSSTFS